MKLNTLKAPQQDLVLVIQDMFVGNKTSIFMKMKEEWNEMKWNEKSSMHSQVMVIRFSIWYL